MSQRQKGQQAVDGQPPPAGPNGELQFHQEQNEQKAEDQGEKPTQVLETCA